MRRQREEVRKEESAIRSTAAVDQTAPTKDKSIHRCKNAKGAGKERGGTVRREFITRLGVISIGGKLLFNIALVRARCMTPGRLIIGGGINQPRRCR